MFRGNGRVPVFREGVDKELLLDRMVHLRPLFRVRIRAHFTMVSHAHIRLRTGEANPGRCTQPFLASHNSCHNHRHGSCGHVFRGRYKALLVEDSKVWRSKATRCIHLIVPRSRLVERPRGLSRPPRAQSVTARTPSCSPCSFGDTE